MKRFFGFMFMVGILSAFVFVANTMGEEMKIEKGKKVKFDYTLKVDGKLVETSEGKTPLAYTHGSQQIIPGLESQLEGLHIGDKKLVTVAPKDGYGEVSKDAFRDFPKTSFPKDMKPETGMVLELQGPDGQKVPATVWEIKEDKVVLNFNHPLAGKTLEFDVKIVSIE